MPGMQKDNCQDILPTSDTTAWHHPDLLLVGYTGMERRSFFLVKNKAMNVNDTGVYSKSI